MQAYLLQATLARVFNNYDKSFHTTGDPKLQQLVNAYRNHGHLKAKLDPLGLVSASSPPAYPLSPQAFGLADAESDLVVEGMLPAFPNPKGSVHEVVAYLEQMYCGTMSLESAHVSVS